MSKAQCDLADHLTKGKLEHRQYAPPTVPQVRKRTPEEKEQQRAAEQYYYRTFGEQPPIGDLWWHCRNPKCPHVLKAAQSAKPAVPESGEKKKGKGPKICYTSTSSSPQVKQVRRQLVLELPGLVSIPIFSTLCNNANLNNS